MTVVLPGAVGPEQPDHLAAADREARRPRPRSGVPYRLRSPEHQTAGDGRQAGDQLGRGRRLAVRRWRPCRVS